MDTEKKKKLIILAAVLVGVVTLPGSCSVGLWSRLLSQGMGMQAEFDGLPPAYEDPLWEKEGLSARQQELAGLLKTAADGRLAAYDGSIPEILEAWTSETGFDAAYTEEQLEALATPPETAVQAVSAAEAIEDAGTAYALLRDGYAGYDYFGGAEAFDRAMDETLSLLPETGEVTVETLRDAILEPLRDTVTDNILTVGYLPAVKAQRRGYYVPGLYFSRPEDAQADAPAEAVPTLTPEGGIAYTLCAQLPESEAGSLPETAVMEGEEISLSWEAMDTEPLPDNPLSETALADGTVLLSSTGFMAADETDAVRLDALSRAGASFSREPVLIWNIRSNRGGSDAYISDWFGGFTGRSPLVRMSYAARVTPLNRYLLNFVLAPWWYVDGRQGQLTPRDGFTFAVQDLYTLGTGESVLCQLRSIENLLTVGSPTAGGVSTGNLVAAYLPHSGLRISWGTKIQRLETDEPVDGIGFRPDLWVPPGEALSRVEAMIGYYGLREWGDALQEQAEN